MCSFFVWHVGCFSTALRRNQTPALILAQHLIAAILGS
jgi:hypothetical protein